MRTLNNILTPNRRLFDSDPFGYSSLARMKWGVICQQNGFQFDPYSAPSSEELKNPILWLSQAHALSEAATLILTSENDFSSMPRDIRTICDSQYCAVGLMLIGYSLEICLKAMIIMDKGIKNYMEEEKFVKHHKLHELAMFVPDLSDKDTAILKLLTHYIYWAGRYPDPGSGREGNSEEIFQLSEEHQIAAKDLFGLSGKVMKHVQTVTN